MTISPIVVSGFFFFGLMVGSFLNVCIWRLPADEQVVKGRSHCRSCGKTIAWYDNVPLASFLFLGGRCRYCKAKISWVYPFVELATGFLFVGLLVRFGLTTFTAIYMFFGAALLLVSVVDAREMILPDQVTIPGLYLAVIVSFFFPALHGATSRWGGLGACLIGALVGAGLVIGMNLIGTRVFRRKLQALGEEEAVGFGDVKLMAMVGALVGAIKAVLVVLFLGPLVGSLVGLILKYRFGKDLIPYGPFLALGTLVALVGGDWIIDWYRGLFAGL